MPDDSTDTVSPDRGIGEPRWPMALGIIAAGLLRAALAPQLRNGDARWLLLVVLAGLLIALIIGDPGRIDREKPWLHVVTIILIAFITLANISAAVRLIVSIIHTASFTNNANVLLASGAAIWLTNVIVFALWYWELDRGGPALRARAAGTSPGFIFPEMINAEHVPARWYPKFVDYLHFSFATATAFSPTDVSAVKPWGKLLMMTEEAVSLVVAILVVARAVNILK
jgi:hypothetical protein